MYQMPPDLPPLQPGRKRRAHKRSRNGCLTCKQRHIRCDEVKPICTNCLTRGGDCGYPEAGGGPVFPGPAGPQAGAGSRPVHGLDLLRQSLLAVPSSPADPFDCLPIKMPHRSLELFHHYVHFRIFSRTAVSKNPDSECVSIALSNPGTFRACLLMTSLNYSWLSAPGSLHTTDMEETYLHHKLEAMRLVNDQLADPVQSISDGCLSLIAALALVEGGMGDHAAAEAHLNGLFTLLDMRRPESWQHRFYGLLQRVILVAGSFIAAAKSLDATPTPLPPPPPPASINLGLHDRPHYTRSPSTLFSTAPMIATRLSPFYMNSIPCVEACKADVEGLVLVNALRRLSSLPVIIDTTTASTPTSSRSYSPDETPPPVDQSHHLPPSITATLLADTDAYIASLLFKPHPLVPEDPDRPVARRTDPYSTLPAELFPSSSRAWATAAYLYLHVLMASKWGGDTSVLTGNRLETEPALRGLLLETLKADIKHTEEAMRLGGYSRELWLWKVVIGAYTVEVVEMGGRDQGKGKGRERREWWGWVLEGEAEGSGTQEEEEQEEGEMAGMGRWFGEKMGVWSQVTGVVDWTAARAVLGRIVWPEREAMFEGEAVVEGLWWRAVGDGGREGRGGLPVMVAVDPRLMC